MNRFRFVLVSALLMFAGGCTNYYRIQDANTSKVYLTKQYKQHADGAVEFKDAITDQTMNLKNAGVQELDKGQYEDSLERLKAQQPPPNKP